MLSVELEDKIEEAIGGIGIVFAGGRICDRCGDIFKPVSQRLNIRE